MGYILKVNTVPSLSSETKLDEVTTAPSPQTKLDELVNTVPFLLRLS